MLKLVRSMVVSEHSSTNCPIAFCAIGFKAMANVGIVCLELLEIRWSSLRKLIVAMVDELVFNLNGWNRENGRSKKEDAGLGEFHC